MAERFYELLNNLPGDIKSPHYHCHCTKPFMMKVLGLIAGISGTSLHKIHTYPAQKREKK